MMLLCRSIVLFVACSVLTGMFGGCQAPSGVLRQQGMEDFRVRNYDAAERNFTRVVQRNPADWKANYYLGQIALINNQPGRARVYLEAAYTVRGDGPPLQPESYDIVDHLAQAIYLQGDYPRLIGFCDEAIQRYGRVADYLRKADYLTKISDPEAALVVYRQAVKIGDGRDAAPHVALADFYDELGDRSAAILQLRQAHAIDPENRQIADRLRAYGVVPGPTATLPPTN